MCIRGLTSRRGAEAASRSSLADREEVEVAGMWEAVARSQVQRAREEQDNSLARSRGNHELRRDRYELRRDMVVEGLVVGFAVVLLIGVAISLVLRPDLVPGTALCSILLAVFRSLLSAARRHRE